MSKHVRTAATTGKIQATLALAHPHGLPALLHPDGTVFTCNPPKGVGGAGLATTCDPSPDGKHFRIGTFDKQSDNLSLTITEELTAAVAAWRTEQRPRARTERVTAYRGFLKKTKAALSKQASAGEAAAPEDHTD
jgi:hypothetical protein